MKRPITLTLLLTFVVLAARAPAQSGTLGDDYIGRQIARNAIIDYRKQSEPNADDARAGAMVLDLAAEFRPDDPILLRYLVASHRAAGDAEGLIEATKHLVRVDPGDEVAQLRLISWSIGQRQTIEQRLAAYADWLDGRGSEFLKDSPAIASRLALDAALMHREAGDEEAFIGRLAQATRLDSSNKEAAAFAAAVFAQRSDDPVARLELSINLLLADPVDPNLHLTIAEQLAAHDVFDQSQRFYANADRLYRLSGANADTASMINALVALDWYASGPASLLEFYETQLRTNRQAAQRRIQKLTELGQPTQDETKPEDVRLDLQRERFRLYAAVAVGDRVAAERSILDWEATTNPVLQRMSDQLRNEDLSEEQRNELRIRGLTIGVESALVRLIANLDIRTVQTGIQVLEQSSGGLLDREVALLRAALRLRIGNLDDALAELEPFSQQTAMGAFFYGMALEQAGRDDEAIEQYQRAADAAPLLAIGVLADSFAERLRGGPAAEPVHAEAMRATAEAVPEWVDRTTGGPRNYMRLSVNAKERILEGTDETVLTIELRNLLPRPLALGGDRPIGTRMAISPQFDVASHAIRNQVNPEVVDAHRKLRLEPGEAMRIDVWPDAGMMGLLADIKAGHRVRARFSVFQSFVFDGGAFRRGPLSLSAESDLITRKPLAASVISPEDLIRYIQTAAEPALLDLLPICRAALADVDFPQGQLDDADAQAVATALAQRYPNLSRRLRAAIVAVIPPARIRSPLATLDAEVVKDPDPAVQRFALLTRAVNPELPALVAAAESDDPDHAWFASYLIDRLSADSPNGFAFIEAPPSHLPEAPESDEFGG